MAEIVIHCPECINRGLSYTKKKKLNLNTTKQVGYCFRCGFRIGPFTFLNYSQSLGIPIPDEPLPSTFSIQLPGEFSRDWTTPEGKIAYRYLQLRHLSKGVIAGYNIGYTAYGPYARRVIVPIYNGGVLVSWQGRDWTGKHSRKYWNAVGSPSQLLFNVDRVRKANVIVLVEGIFDALRLPNFCIALMGKGWSDAKREQILALHPKLVILGLDADQAAAAATHEIQTDLGGLVPLEQLPLHTKDLGDVSPNTARQLNALLEKINSVSKYVATDN